MIKAKLEGILRPPAQCAVYLTALVIFTCSRCSYDGGISVSRLTRSRSLPDLRGTSDAELEGRQGVSDPSGFAYEEASSFFQSLTETS